MAWTYILRCNDGSYYTGSTEKDLDIREWEHNHDDTLAANFTRKRRPVRIVYAEQFEFIEQAFRREKQLQGWSRAKKEALIEGRGQDLPNLARSRASTSSASNSASTSSTSNGASTGSASNSASTGSASNRASTSSASNSASTSSASNSASTSSASNSASTSSASKGASTSSASNGARTTP